MSVSQTLAKTTGHASMEMQTSAVTVTEAGRARRAVCETATVTAGHAVTEAPARIWDTHTCAAVPPIGRAPLAISVSNLLFHLQD